MNINTVLRFAKWLGLLLVPLSAIALAPVFLLRHLESGFAQNYWFFWPAYTEHYFRKLPIYAIPAFALMLVCCVWWFRKPSWKSALAVFFVTDILCGQPALSVLSFLSFSR